MKVKRNIIHVRTKKSKKRQQFLTKKGEKRRRKKSIRDYQCLSWQNKVRETFHERGQIFDIYHLRRQSDTNLIPPIHMGEQSDRLVCDIAFVKIKDNTLSKAIFKKKKRFWDFFVRMKTSLIWLCFSWERYFFFPFFWLILLLISIYLLDTISRICKTRNSFLFISNTFNNEKKSCIRKVPNDLR